MEIYTKIIGSIAGNAGNDHCGSYRRTGAWFLNRTCQNKKNKGFKSDMQCVRVFHAWHSTAGSVVLIVLWSADCIAGD